MPGDNFESYSIGQQIPFGDWSDDGIVFIHDVRAGGPHTSTKCLNLFGPVYWNDTNYRASLTVTFWAKSPPSIAFTNLFYAANGTHVLLRLDREFDGTHSVENIGNSEIPVSGNIWNSYQLNLQFSAVGTVFVDCELWINGVLHLTGSYDTGVLESSLANMLASVDRLGFSGSGGNCFIDELDVAAKQTGSYFPTPGTPKARVARADIDLIELPDDALIRIARADIDLVELPDSAKIRIAQAYIEIIFLPAQRWYVTES